MEPRSWILGWILSRVGEDDHVQGNRAARTRRPILPDLIPSAQRLARLGTHPSLGQALREGIERPEAAGGELKILRDGRLGEKSDRCERHSRWEENVSHRGRTG